MRTFGKVVSKYIFTWLKSIIRVEQKTFDGRVKLNTVQKLFPERQNHLLNKSRHKAVFLTQV